MNEDSNFAYFCVVCGESFPRRLTGGIVAIKSKAICSLPFVRTYSMGGHANLC